VKLLIINDVSQLEYELAPLTSYTILPRESWSLKISLAAGSYGISLAGFALRPKVGGFFFQAFRIKLQHMKEMTIL